MPYLNVLLTPTATSVVTNYGTGTLWGVRLQEYYAAGLTSTDPIFFTIRNQNVGQVYGNIHSSFYPLYFNQFPNNRVQLHHPMDITNGQYWNDAHQLQFQLVNSAGQPFTQFSQLFLKFSVHDQLNKSLGQNQYIDESLQQI